MSQPHPPIWIGGNTAAAREQVMKVWRRLVLLPGACRPCADRAHRSARLAGSIVCGDRDWSRTDITFTNNEGGNPGADGFNADAYLSGVEKLAALGVTWLQVSVPGDSLAHAAEAIERFGTSVIKAA